MDDIFEHLSSIKRALPKKENVPGFNKQSNPTLQLHLLKEEIFRKAASVNRPIEFRNSRYYVMFRGGGLVMIPKTFDNFIFDSLAQMGWKDPYVENSGTI